MNYSVFLGPDKRYIPDGKWDSTDKTLHDLVFRRSSPNGWYKATLTNGEETIDLGLVFHTATHAGEWGCIPNPSHLDKTITDGHQLAVKRYSQQGFATRLRAAEYLMRVQEFTDPLGW